MKRLKVIMESFHSDIIESFSNKDLKIILKSLKRKGDTALPTKKNEMVQLYHEWKGREPIKFDLSGPVGVTTAITNNIDDDEIDDPNNIHEV